MFQRNLNITRQKVPKLLNSFLSFCCIFVTGFMGCQRQQQIMTVEPEQTKSAQLTNRFPAARPVVKEPNVPEIQTIGYARNNPDKSTTLSDALTSEKTKSNSLNTWKRTVPDAAKSQVPPFGEIQPTSRETPTYAEQLSSDTQVNMPALNKPGMADELISVNFNQVDIRAVLKTIGDITGINFVVDENVRGAVTVMSPTKIRLDQIYKVLESILEVHGYAAVPAGDLVKIVPKGEAIKRNLQVFIGGDPSKIPENDTLITQIIPLSYADAAEVSQIIRTLLATGSQMSTYPRTNSIVITDTSSNIHHIAKIIHRLDVEGSKEHVTVFSLNYASAQVLSEQISHIMDNDRSASSQAARNRGITQIETGIKIMPDERTNSIIVVANAQDTETIAKLAKQLDVQRPIGTNNVHVVYLKNAQSDEVAESLTAALTNLRITGVLEAARPVQVTADKGTNSLIIAASPQDYEVIAEIIDKLDIVREQILVELFIVEVSDDSLRQIGIDWAELEAAIGTTIIKGQAGFGPRVNFAAGNLEGLGIGAWAQNNSGEKISAILHALEKTSGVNILSTPHITTSNHHKAKIVVGENTPFVTQSRITETDPGYPTSIQTLEYRDVGITMEITPHVSMGGLVRLEIESEFTKLIEGVTNIDVETPTTTKRQAQTVVTMNSGSTIVIGGLIRDDKVTTEKKVPLLGDMPFIAPLFRYQTDRLQKTNLLIFITPYVMSSQQDLDRMTEEKKEEMKSELEKLERQKGNTKNL